MSVECFGYGARGRAFRFSGKPSEKIRTALKAQGFRWSPGEGIWWRLQSGEWADLLLWIQKELATPGASVAEFVNAEWERREADRRRIAADDFDLANNRSL